MTPIEQGLMAINDGLMLLPPLMDSHKARVMLIAIGLQESRFIHRKQIGGPARGFWQFEKGGGVKGVMTHRETKGEAKRVCDVLGVEPSIDAVYQALSTNDRLAAAIARLLLWSDSRPLPPPDDAEAGWQCYIRNWRPGKPHRQTWGAFYKQAQEVA